MKKTEGYRSCHPQVPEPPPKRSWFREDNHSWARARFIGVTAIAIATWGWVIWCLV